MLYLGLDGGGTGCRARLSDAEGAVLAEAQAGPANIASDFDAAFANIMQAVTQLAIPAGEDISAVLGLAGANLSGAGPRLEATLPFRARVVQDVVTSVRGALHDADGIVAAIGTGSVFARQIGGKILSTGGWGLRLGDEGSGAWIGHALVALAARALDGRFERTPLLTRLTHDLGGSTGLVAFSLSATPADWATLAPQVFDTTDTAALTVLAAARAEIRAAIEHLQPQGAQHPVVWLGGLGVRLAMDDWPRLAPRGTSLDGALWMARQESTWTD